MATVDVADRVDELNRSDPNSIADVFREIGLGDLLVQIPTTIHAQKRSVQILHSDLTASATSEAINIGDTLPANARIIAVGITVATAMSGGSAGAVTVDVGTSGDADALVDGANIFAAVDGQAATRPLGIAPNKVFVTEGAQLIATVIADVNVVALTAGDVTIDVLFVVDPS